MATFCNNNRPEGFGGFFTVEPPAGAESPEFPGCVWVPEFGAYVCDDGFTVNGLLPQPVKTFKLPGIDTPIKQQDLILYGGMAVAGIVVLALLSRQ